MLLASACLVALVACAPTISLATGNKVIKIDLTTHHKYGEPSLENLERHVAEISRIGAANGGVVPMSNYKNMYYYGNLTMGTPNQTFNASYDTVTGNFLVPSKKLCSRPQCADFCRHHNTFDGEKSSSYKKKGRKFSIYHNWVQGVMSQDTIYLGDAEVKKQMFGEVTNFTVDPIGPKYYDIVLGLAYRDASELNVDPPFINMVKRKVVNEAVFSMYLNNCGCGCACSELMLGGVNPKRYKGDLTYTKVTEKKYFQISIDGMHLGSEAVVPPISAIVATGTSLIYGPKDYMNYINKAIGGKPSFMLYIVDCAKIPSMPDVTVTVSGNPLVMKPENYTIKLSGVCISGFVGLDMANVVLGDVFLRTFYTVYDMVKDRVGFAPVK